MKFMNKTLMANSKNEKLTELVGKLKDSHTKLKENIVTGIKGLLIEDFNDC